MCITCAACIGAHAWVWEEADEAVSERVHGAKICFLIVVVEWRRRVEAERSCGKEV